MRGRRHYKLAQLDYWGLYATALLTEDINALRPPELRVIIPEVDARLWLNYHTTHWPHHLTRTIMY